MKVTTLCLVFVSCFSGSAWADCEPPHALHVLPQFTLTPEKIDARYRVYVTACNKVGGDLIDAESETYHDRLGKGVLANLSPEDTYPSDLLRRGISGEVTVGAVVEPNGKVSEAMLIGSSGYKGFDDGALYQIRHYRYQQPYTLDGIPVRVFKTYIITYHTS